MRVTLLQRRANVRLVGVALLAVAILAGGGFAVWWYWLRSEPKIQAAGQGGESKPRVAVPVPPVRFTDVTEKAGIRFRHTNGSFGKKLLPETMGPGVAVLDFDKDGKPDLFFVNSCYWPGYEPKGQPVPTLALYRNKGSWQFEDVTAAAGLAITMYGMGACSGDYDNDGWPDLFVTGVGGNRLFHNEPDGKGGRRFVDVTGTAGVGGPGGWPTAPGDFLKVQTPLNFSSSATFFDYNGDARLDLFVCNYVVWSPEIDLSQAFTLTGGDRAFGPPRPFGGTHCFLYRNEGNGRFVDVSNLAGVQVVSQLDQVKRAVGKSLGVLVSDVDDDGAPDVFVANDTVRNFFFHNQIDAQRGRRFVEMGVHAGVAYAEGTERGAMGIDRGEYRPGRDAVLIGNFSNEPNTFLRQEIAGRLAFQDVAVAEGIAGPSRPLLKFGVFLFDYDNDCRQDLFTANGHLEPDIGKVQPGQTYEQPAQLFWNTGAAKRCFEPVTAEQAGSDLFKPLVGRGCAYADFDGDGFLDVVLTGNGGPVRLLRNEGVADHHWIRLVLEGDGKRSNRSAIGAKVTLEAGGVTQHREIAGARGYLSQSELTVTFGLGRTAKVDRLTIRWPGPDGGTQELTEAERAVDRVHVIQQK